MPDPVSATDRVAQPDSPEAYDVFAAMYAQHFGHETERRFLPIHQQLVLGHLPAAARIVDLCCGSGQLADALARRGFEVIGIDNSEQMLCAARANAPSVRFELADSRSFELSDEVHAVLCTYNSLAHIPTQSELVEVFRSVRRALHPGGFFLFDVFLEEAYRRNWRGSFSVLGKETVCTVHASFDPATRVGINRVVMFDRRGENRRECLLTQRCYRPEEFVSGLEEAGFLDIHHYDAERDLGLRGESGRGFFLARVAIER